MILNKKKGQITIFVILGIILVLGVVLFIFLSSSDEEIEFDDSHVSSRLNMYLSQCSDIIVEDYVPRALITGGYGQYPFNLVRTDTNPYVLSYSAEGIPYGIYNSDIADLFLRLELDEIYTCLMPLIDSEEEQYGDEVILYDLKKDVTIEQNAIIVKYDYIYSYRGEVINNNEVTRRYITNLGHFLDKTNRLTDMFLEQRRPDALFNYQFCNALLDQKGYPPKYSADFLIGMEEDVTFLFEREFFVVFLEKDEEIFPFAIMPLHNGYFC